MNAEKIEQVLRALHVSKISVATRTQGQLVRATCPLAPWLHSSGKDSHPSFSITVENDDRSFCNCMACHFRGGMIDLLRKIEFVSKTKLTGLINLVSVHDQANLAEELEKTKGGRGLYTMPSPDGPTYVWNGAQVTDLVRIADDTPALGPEHAPYVEKMAQYVDDYVLDYLTSTDRNFDKAGARDIVSRWKLGYHPVARRVAIPQYDHQHRLVNIGGRYLASVLDDWEPTSWMHSEGFKKKLYLFGEDRITSYDGKGTCFIVEGMFDVIWLDSRGIPNVLAICGSDLSPFQREKIVKWFNRVVIIPDGDAPGKEAADKMVEALGSRISVNVFPTPFGKDPDQLSEEQVSDLKSRFLS